ncbi:MAG: hypothetical protein KAW93_01350 [Methanogenium sp.]|nr:hypothetical protein [Methanogenium sp.]
MYTQYLVPGTFKETYVPGNALNSLPFSTPSVHGDISDSTAGNENSNNVGDIVSVNPDLNAISKINLIAEPADWNAENGNDGIIVHFFFYDAEGKQVVFSGADLNAKVSIYTPDFGVNRVPLSSPKVLYQGYAKITNSDQGLSYPLRGIRIAYSDLALTSNDLGIGQIKLKITLPTGKVVEGNEKYLYTK